MFNQWDSLWRSVKIGNKTLGTDGCLVVAICEGMNKLYKIPITPPDFVKELGPDAFLEDGQLIWSYLQKAYPKVTFQLRVDTELAGMNRFGRETMAQAIHTVEKAVRMGQIVVINVDNIRNDGRPDHWILVKDVEAGLWKVGNPDGGTDHFFHNKYGRKEEGFWGYAVILGETAEFPKEATKQDKILGNVAGKLGMASQGNDVQRNIKESIDLII